MWGKRILVCHPQVWFDLWFLTDAFYQIKNLVIFFLKLPSNISLTSKSCVLSNAFSTFTKKTKYFFSCFVLLRGTLPHEAKARSFNSTEDQTHARTHKLSVTSAHRLSVTPAHRLSVTPACKLSVMDACTQAECASYHWFPSHLFTNVQLALYYRGGIPLVNVLSFKILLVRVGEMAQQLRAFVYPTGTQVWSPASTWWLICHSISGG